MATQTDVAARIINTLALTEPDLDTSVGSVTRKIIDAVAESVADSYTDGHLLNYQFDVDSKIGGDLEEFTQQFGMSRVVAKRATGTVIFYRGPEDANREATIPIGTQVSTLTTPVVFVQTVTAGFMDIGVVSVEVPVQAVVPGASGNIAAGALINQATPLAGILATTNINPLSGGTSPETDEELRERWKRTVFRSLAGTESMYLGVALNADGCYAANVVGATKTRREQVQVLSGMATSVADDVAYVYPDTAALAISLDDGNLLLRDYDYSLDTSVRPPRVIMNGETYPTGEVDETSGEPLTAPVEGVIFDLSYDYAPRDSRNLPSQGITNRVDIWCAGVVPETAVQAVIFQTSLRFSVSKGSPYYFRKYLRQDGSLPEPGAIFIPLAFGPIISVPGSLAVANETYFLGTDYFLVHDDSPFGYSFGSRYGLEWRTESIPDALNPVFVVGANEDYVFNALPRNVQSGVERWRLAGVDAVAHAAKLQQLRFNLVVMYDRQGSPAVTNPSIETAISGFLTSRTFDSTVQASDILAVVHGVTGVDNVRFLHGADWPTYSPGSPNDYGVGIQRVVNGVVVESYVDDQGYPRDVTFGDAELPVFESIRGDRLNSDGTQVSGTPAVRAQNTFFSAGA